MTDLVSNFKFEQDDKDNSQIKFSFDLPNGCALYAYPKFQPLATEAGDGEYKNYLTFKRADKVISYIAKKKRAYTKEQLIRMLEGRALSKEQAQFITTTLGVCLYFTRFIATSSLFVACTDDKITIRWDFVDKNWGFNPLGV